MRVNKISETLFEVMGYSVKIQIKKGRKLLLCSCQNHARFCNENPFCYHKELVIRYLATENLSRRLDELLNEYKSYLDLNIANKMKKQEDILVMIIEDLENLRRKL